MAKIRKTLGEKLRELRESFDLSQSQVAAALNIDRSTYSNYELDRTQPNLETLVKLARIFNVPKASLLPDDDDDDTISFRDAISDSGMLKSLTKEERGLVARYRAMSRAEKDRMKARVEEITNNGDE